METHSLFIEKKKLINLVFFSVIAVTLLAPIANAEIKVTTVIIPDVVASSSPNYGNIDLKIQVEKPSGTADSLTIPVMLNGTAVTTVTVEMKANETIKSVPVAFTFPGASIMMMNPFPTTNLANVKYDVKLNPFANPIDHIDYDIKMGSFEKVVAVLVYPDWTFWAIIVDIVVVAGTFFALRRAFSG